LLHSLRDICRHVGTSIHTGGTKYTRLLLLLLLLLLVLVVVVLLLLLLLVLVVLLLLLLLEQGLVGRGGNDTHVCQALLHCVNLQGMGCVKWC